MSIIQDLLLSKLSGWEGVQGVKIVRDNAVSKYLVAIRISNTMKDSAKKWKYPLLLRLTTI